MTLASPFFCGSDGEGNSHCTPLSCQTWVHPKNQLLVHSTTFFIKLMSLSISFLDAKMKTHLLPMFKRLCTISCFHTIFSIISYITKVLLITIHCNYKQFWKLWSLDPQVWIRGGHTFAGNKRRGLCINGETTETDNREKRVKLPGILSQHLYKVQGVPFPREEI